MKAVEDDDFRARLVADPCVTVEEETGLRFPDGYQLHVHEESATAAHLSTRRARRRRSRRLAAARRVSARASAWHRPRRRTSRSLRRRQKGTAEGVMGDFGNLDLDLENTCVPHDFLPGRDGFARPDFELPRGASGESGEEISGIVGASDGIRQVLALLKQAAENDVGVLVHGESGTGKELVARALHFNGPRRTGPLRAVSCAALPETIGETELFGNERGAFTGATESKTGYFEEADGGTLLLDEIGDMPPALQSRLLRVLQEHEIRRVGGGTTIPVDVRVVAATNQDLEAAMRAGAFRKDLFYRLAAFPIEVPPLRTRQDDIPLLADHFLKKHAARLDKPLRGIAAGVVDALAQHAWPGNVRELENAVQRAVVLETTDMLQATSFPPELVPPLGPRPRPPAATVATLAETERRAIAAALDSSDGNLTHAAKALGINRATLHRKLKRYDQSARD